MTPRGAKKDIITINIIKTQQNNTDLRTLHKKQCVSLLFFGIIKCKFRKNNLHFSIL